MNFINEQYFDSVNNNKKDIGGDDHKIVSHSMSFIANDGLGIPKTDDLEWMTKLYVSTIFKLKTALKKSRLFTNIKRCTCYTESFFGQNHEDTLVDFAYLDDSMDKHEECFRKTMKRWISFENGQEGRHYAFRWIFWINIDNECDVKRLSYDEFAKSVAEIHGIVSRMMNRFSISTKHGFAYVHIENRVIGEDTISANAYEPKVLKEMYTQMLEVNTFDDEEIIYPKLDYVWYTTKISEKSTKGIDDFNRYDILYSTSEGELVSDSQTDGEDNFPIGICIFPSEYRDKNFARFIALNTVSAITPDQGCWNMSETNPWAHKDDYSISELETLSLDNGWYNTEKLYEYINNMGCQEPNWKTGRMGTYNMSDGDYGLVFPNIMETWRYHTIGTPQGSWYIPAIDELSIFKDQNVVMRLNIIREKLGLPPMRKGTAKYQSSSYDAEYYQIWAINGNGLKYRYEISDHGIILPYLKVY